MSFYNTDSILIRNPPGVFFPNYKPMRKKKISVMITLRREWALLVKTVVQQWLAPSIGILQERKGQKLCGDAQCFLFFLRRKVPSSTVGSMDSFLLSWNWGSWLDRMFVCFSWKRIKGEGNLLPLAPCKHIPSSLCLHTDLLVRSGQPALWGWGNLLILSSVQGNPEGCNTNSPNLK